MKCEMRESLAGNTKYLNLHESKNTCLNNRVDHSTLTSFKFILYFNE